MKQVISKDGRVVCVTTAPYNKQTVAALKKAGYKVREVQDGKTEN